MAARDKQAQEELKATKRQLEAEISKLQRESQQMGDRFGTQISELEAVLEEERRDARFRVEQLEEQLENLQDSRSNTTSEFEKLKLELQIDKLEAELKIARQQFQPLTVVSRLCNIM